MDKFRLHLIIKLSWRKVQPQLTHNAQGKNNTKEKEPSTSAQLKKFIFSEKSSSGKNIFKSSESIVHLCFVSKFLQRNRN